jgi:hypothetical protein
MELIWIRSQILSAVKLVRVAYDISAKGDPHFAHPKPFEKWLGVSRTWNLVTHVAKLLDLIKV